MSEMGTATIKRLLHDPSNRCFVDESGLNFVEACWPFWSRGSNEVDSEGGIVHSGL